MSLNWKYDNEEHWDSLNENQQEIVSRFCFILMAVGVGKVTEKNWRDVYQRISFYEKVLGSHRSNGEGPVYYTEEYVKSMIGYWCNATTFSKTEFIKRVYDSYTEN